MAWRAPIRIPPTAADLAIARAIWRRQRPALAAPLNWITCVADERLVVSGAALLWIYLRGTRQDAKVVRQGDRILACALVTTVLPHLLKRVVCRERPDRRIVWWFRHGIPRSGAPYDSFPSGHAMHLGALVPAVRPLVPPPLRALLWPAAILLASTRVLLLAHYATDVATGLGSGIALERMIGKMLR